MKKEQGNVNKVVLRAFCIFIFLVVIYFQNEAVYGMDESGNIVVVIDPGHGGLKQGTDYGAVNDGDIEKNINMQVAAAMKSELEKYCGVTVYLTHSSADESVSLHNRAVFAKSVNVDFLFSIHFNASENHEFYGAEVWIPSIGEYYVKGRQFANIEMKNLVSEGLFDRGIKTRIGDDSDEYYGIIRECEWLSVPAVIIEHCYIDNLKDRTFCDSDDDFIRFGQMDAMSVAQYFGLKSDVIGVDYSGFKKEQVDAPTQRIYQDITPPEVISTKYVSYDKKNKALTLDIKANDDDGEIKYYSYSTDGGKTFSELMPWDNTGRITIPAYIQDKSNKLSYVVKVYNKYNLSGTGKVTDIKADELVNETGRNHIIIKYLNRYKFYTMFFLMAAIIVFVLRKRI